MVYDIPGIFTSVNDRSYAQEVVLGGRSVLIAGFSKFGTEDFHFFSDIDKMKFTLGELDIKKYGLGLFYAIGALNKTRNVIFKRLLPKDAKFSNLVFQSTGSGTGAISKTDIIDYETFKSLVLEDNDTMAAAIAKARGEGYNNIYIKFSPAEDVEKFYADAEGDVKYRFNFLQVTIYEESASGVKTKSNEFIVSLIDVDPKTNVPITDTLLANEMFVNKKFGKSNEYVDFFINEDKLPDLKENLNIEELTADYVDGEEVLGANRVILKDSATGKNFEIIADKDGKLELQATVTEGRPAFYLSTPSGQTQAIYILKVENGELSASAYAVGVPAGEVAYSEVFIDGDDSFWKLKIDDTATSNLISIRYTTPRQELYNTLIKNDGLWQLKSGSDGENLHINETLNLYNQVGVNGTTDSENAKMLLMNFFDTDGAIREVIYPELDFDYVPDWSGDIDIQNSIVKFADEIGVTMPIVSFRRTSTPDDDYKRRKEDLYFSSYNTLIYSGQSNDNHYVPETGQIISCPLSYYAMLLHLTIDNNMSITEPVANMNKGALPVAGAKLSYIAKSADIAKLRSVQINTVIKETDGIYLIDQLTAYKNASKLSRANVVKVIHRMRKDIPKRLKDLLQLKAINDITGRAEARVREYMDKWKASQDNVVDGIFEAIEVNSVFISEEFKLVIAVAVTPIGTVEKIEIPITVL